MVQAYPTICAESNLEPISHGESGFGSGVESAWDSLSLARLGGNAVN